MATDDTNSGVPLWWLVMFLLIALGAGAATIFFVGGSVITWINLSSQQLPTTPLVILDPMGMIVATGT
jgi:ABC-type multidrug transport system permease subunit